MTNTGRSIVFAVIILLAGAALWWSQNRGGISGTNEEVVGKALYLCDNDQTIDATFYDKAGATATSAPGQPPAPTGRVSLALSDGRALALPQTISGSGIRYATSSEYLVFWSKGNTAFVTESGTTTYGGCIKAEADPGNLPEAYADRHLDFTIRYPEGYAVDPNYQYQGFGPGKDISGVKFTIPKSAAAGTNLGTDTYLSVEELPRLSAQTGSSCTASLFLPDSAAANTKEHEVTDGGMDYSLASTTGAAAGNRYEETVYAIPGSSPCTAVRYFIHYGVIENYPPGAVRQFDEAALLAQFDAIRRTLVLGS